MTPSRCRIIIGESRWYCRSFGCGVLGTLDGDELVDPDGKRIERAAATGPHLPSPGEVCLFDRPPEAVVVTRNQFKAWLEEGYRQGTHEQVTAELERVGSVPAFLVERETPNGKRWVFR